MLTALRLHAPGSLAENVWCAAHFTPFVQGPDGTVYALDEGMRRRLPDAETFRRYRGASPDLAEVRTLDADALGKIPEGPPLASAASGPIFVNDLAFVYRVTEDGLAIRLSDHSPVEVEVE